MSMQNVMAQPFSLEKSFIEAAAAHTCEKRMSIGPFYSRTNNDQLTKTGPGQT
jgi:hypothetical protein